MLRDLLANRLRHRLAQGAIGAAAVLPVPVVAGDVPDPSAIFDNGQHVAVTTANGWAPSLRLFSSPNLSAWTLRGQVFVKPPKWAKANFWAPEITKLSEGNYAVYYASRSKRKGDPWYCVGAAFSRSALGPYRDLGKPIRCGKYGSIDPYVTRDEFNRRVLIYKDDGNEFKRTTHIYAQLLSEDGKKVSGPSKELIRDEQKWEGKVVEAPNIVRVGNTFHLIYAGGLFGGTKGCDYAIGTARATSLWGPYQKDPKNPIVRSGAGWKCPGHASVYPVPGGGFNALYHAYRAGAGVIAGRQIISEPAQIGPDGFFQIGDDGTPPPPSPGAATLDFRDSFKGKLNPYWEWPFERAPAISTGSSLKLRASSKGGTRLDAGVIARRTVTERYTADAYVDRGSLRGAAQAGLGSYRNQFEGIGVSVDREGKLTVWQRRFGKYSVRARGTAPKGGLLRFRMIARGDVFTFQVSSDGKRYTTVGGRAIRGPIEESARPALTVGGVKRATARFTYAAVKSN